MEVYMNRFPKAVYTKEFREEVVKLAMTEGVGVSEAARRVSISMEKVANWARAAKAGKLECVGQHQKPLTEVEAELGRVKRELAEIKLERDLLKKFATFSGGSRGEVRRVRTDEIGLSGASPMCRLLGVFVCTETGEVKRCECTAARGDAPVGSMARAAHRRAEDVVIGVRRACTSVARRRQARSDSVLAVAAQR
jgi:transposase